MRILPDGTVEIRNKRTGATKIVQPNDLPSYGISYSTYESEKSAYEKSILGEEPPTAEEKKQVAKKETLSKTLSILEKNLGQVEIRGPVAGRMGWLSTLTGGAMFPEVADYEAMRKSLIGPIARVISGEVGVLTDKDIARAEKMLPFISDTKRVAKEKLANIRELIGKKGEEAVVSERAVERRVEEPRQAAKVPGLLKFLLPRASRMAEEPAGREQLRRGVTPLSTILPWLSAGRLATRPGGGISREGVGALGEAGAYALPAGLGLAKGGALAGGLLGATAPEEMGVGERLGRIGLGAGVGAVTGKALGVAGKGFQWLAQVGKPLKEKLANQILGLTPRKVRLTPEGTSWLSEKLIEKLDDGTLKSGNFQSMRQQAGNLLSTAESQIDDILTKRGSTKTIKTSNLLNSIDDLITQASKQGNKSKAKGLEKFKEDVGAHWGDNLTVSQVLDLKRTMDAALADSVFTKRASEIVGTRASAQRALGSKARDWLRNAKVLGGEIGDLLTDESVYINLRTAMENQLRKAGTAPLKGGYLGGLSPTSLMGRLGVGAVTRPEMLSKRIAQQPGILSKVLRGVTGGAGRTLESSPLMKMLMVQTGRF